MWILLQRWVSWLGYALAPWVISLVFSFLASLGVAQVSFIAVDIMIEELFKIIDSMLSGLIPLNSKSMVESAGLFLSLKIYLYALGTRLSLVLSFMVFGMVKNVRVPGVTHPSDAAKTPTF